MFEVQRLFISLYTDMCVCDYVCVYIDIHMYSTVHIYIYIISVRVNVPNDELASMRV